MARKVSTLVNPLWLAEKMGSSFTPKANFRVIDASWHMPNTKRSGKDEFIKQHIPTSQFFDIDACCDKTSSYDHMIPTPEKFNDYVGNLGINNDTHVLLYDNNASLGLFSSQRVWFVTS